MADPIFIFMLTRNDATVPDAAALAREALAAGVRHIGFKDVGQSAADLRSLMRLLKGAGATTYLEVVSLAEASERASAALALALGVDNLLGGTRPRAIAPMVQGQPLHYFPFAGRIEGHPSVLKGSPAEVAANAREIGAIPGVDGIDLLAWRGDGDGAQMASAVCASAGLPVILAGSIDRVDRIAAVRACGAYGFTVGTAALEGAFAAGADLGAQLAAIEGARTATDVRLAS